jgi:hypothetical protein
VHHIHRTIVESLVFVSLFVFSLNVDMQRRRSVAGEEIMLQRGHGQGVRIVMLPCHVAG